ncbi:MAG: PTS fructose IIA subunit family protein [Rhodanobacteraceae bacterium]
MNRVGVLLLTHEAMGAALVAAARHVLGRLPLPVGVQEVAADADPEQLLRTAAGRARELDGGGGVLVLSDLYGATPCNIAQRLPDLGVRMHCVSGLNLPMLLRVLNYPEQGLDELAETAASGGRGGIFIDHA